MFRFPAPLCSEKGVKCGPSPPISACWHMAVHLGTPGVTGRRACTSCHVWRTRSLTPAAARTARLTKARCVQVSHPHSPAAVKANLGPQILTELALPSTTSFTSASSGQDKRQYVPVHSCLGAELLLSEPPLLAYRAGYGH